MRIPTIAAAGTGVLLTLAAASTTAADAGPLTSDVYIALGAYAFSADTKLRIDGEADEPGTEVDWERDLGLDDKSSFRIDAFWRFADRHKLRLMYFDNERSNSRPLQRDITIEGQVYPLDAVVRASAETRVVELAYEYAFLRRDSYEISGTLGVHLTELAPAIEITGAVNGANATVGQSADVEVDAPLPVLGLRGLWRLGEHFYFDAHAQYFYLSINGNEGAFTDFRAALTWNPTGRFGVGVGYNQFSTDVDVDVDSFSGEVDWTYRGPQVFLAVTF